MGYGGVSRLEVLVDVNGELGNLSRPGQLWAAAPVAITAKGINVGKNPCSNHEIRLLAGLSQQIEPNRNSIIFKTDEEVFGVSNGLLFGGNFGPSGDGFNKRGC